MSNKKYWLRGGLAVLGAGILLLAVQFFDQCYDDCPITFVDRISYIAVYPIVPLINKIVRIEDGWLLLILPLYFFTIGSFAGWIYGKISNWRNSYS